MPSLNLIRYIRNRFFKNAHKNAVLRAMRAISAWHHRQLYCAAITNYKTDIIAAVPVWKFLNAAHTHTWHPNTKINKCTSQRKRRKDAVWNWKQRCRSVEPRCAAAEPAGDEFPYSLTCPTRDTRRSMFDNGNQERRSANDGTDRQTHDLPFCEAHSQCVFDKLLNLVEKYRTASSFWRPTN